jgi:hypothetical protein
MTNVFVIGLDPFNLATAQSLRESRRYAFYPLLPLAKVRHAPSYDYDALLREADDQLRGSRARVDGIVTWWDFPGTTLVPALADLWDLPGPDLRSVVMLEHKYWSRLVQRLLVPAHVPPFVAFDPLAHDPLRSVLDAGLDYPFWVKPVKSVASYLGFRIEGPDDFVRAMGAIRPRIGHFGDPFQQVLSRVSDLPSEIGRVGGKTCLAEGIISGRQCTLEGYVSFGQVRFYGAVDSLRRDGSSSFRAYRYPSVLPPPVVDRMAEIATKVVAAAGLNDSCFNVEFLFDEDHERIWLLEFNVRLSQSHCDLFAKVDGASSQRVLLDVARGKSPRMPHRRGEYAVAGKYFLRANADGTVRSAPSPSDVAAVAERFPGARVDLDAAPGMRLSELRSQDSYSYELGRVFVGADDYRSLEERITQIEDMLHFDIEPVRAAS